MRIRCHSCHEEIDSVLLDCFDRYGGDSRIPHAIETPERREAGCPCVAIITNANWCGQGLDEEEQLDCVHCPECGKFPFAHRTMNVATPLDIVMFPSEEDIVVEEEENAMKDSKKTKGAGFKAPTPVTHQNVQVPKTIADRIVRSDGGTLVLENNMDAYNVGDRIEFEVVMDAIGSVDNLHDICDRAYEVTYVYSGRGIEPGYVLVQFRETAGAD